MWDVNEQGGSWVMLGFILDDSEALCRTLEAETVEVVQKYK